MSGTSWAGVGPGDVPLLSAQVLRVRRIVAGTGVSYGHTWRAPRDTTVALVGIGYADGIPRRASNLVDVAVGGVRMPVVGRIAMNALTVDVGEHPVAVGDEVVLWGPGDDGLPTAAEWADAVGTTAEVLAARLLPPLGTGTPATTAAAAGVRATVDLAAIRRDLEVVAARVAPVPVLVVVKGAGLGHGAAEVARTAVTTGIEWFGVLTVEAGVHLRAELGERPRLLAWLHAADEDFADAVAADLDVAIGTLAQLDAVVAAATAVASRVRLHLSIDTGIVRDGAAPEEWADLVEAAVVAERDGRVELVGVMSHVAEAGDDEDTRTRDRFAAAAELAEAVSGHAVVRHLAASAISWTRPDMRFDLVRVGAHGVGIPVPDDMTAAEMGLVPALTLTAPVQRIDDAAAVLPIGAAHGLPANAAGRVRVLAGGALREVLAVGPAELRIAARATDAAPALAVGDEAVLFGSGASGEWTVRQWGDACGTIGEEIVTQLQVPIDYRAAPASDAPIATEGTNR